MAEDALSRTLAALRISGAIVQVDTYRLPWAIAVPSHPELARLLDAAPDARVVAFHFAARGAIEVLSGPGAPRPVGPGEIVVLFGGEAHELRAGRRGRRRRLEEVLTGRDRPERPRPDEEGTELVCGVFLLRDTELNPLFAALPPVLVLPLDPELAATFGRLLTRELLVGAPGAAYLVERALEVLFGGVVRAHLEQAGDGASGFIRGLRDPRIRRALERIHAEPGAPWTLEALARASSLSRSRFASLFNEVLGESPMGYLTGWRMNVALRHLRAGALGVKEVAALVGYDSVPAFSRAFKRRMGTPPTAFRPGEPSPLAPAVDHGGGDRLPLASQR